MINLWPLLLPAAAWSGWYLAHRSNLLKASNAVNYLSREYVLGLNYLLNEQTDKAVDLFIKLLEVDSETVETHLALGSLFRRRGEVDRAIRIHQNLIARPQLSLALRKEALMALGQDYMSAGVFDRAERIFLEVVELGGDLETRSLQGLLAIYQQEKSWDQGLEIIRKLEKASGARLNSQSAHYYCELASQALKSNTHDQAYQAVKEALQVDSSSVRASLLLAQLEIAAGRYKPAIAALKRIPEQDPEFLNEMIEPLVFCHRQLDIMDECIDYLEQTLMDHPRVSVIFVIGDYLRQEKSLDLAIDFVAAQLSRYPSIRGLNHLIDWHLDSVSGKAQDKLRMLYDITSKLLENKPVYRCSHCGFSGKSLYWHCPSCKQWGKIKPIHGLEGD